VNKSLAKDRTRSQRSELKNTAYEIFIGFLSILSIFNLVLVYVLAADPELQSILSALNALLSVIFLGDFLYRIGTAESAARYFFAGFGWADLLASLPFPQFKVLRVFRLIRVARLLRELGIRTILRTLVRDRANSALMTLLMLGILVLEFGSLWILRVEGDAENANIVSASDALWYVVVTISTVGYGDQYPVTNAGRIIGTCIIVVGVGIFGTFTGYLANVFLGPAKRGDASGADGDAARAGQAGTAVDGKAGSVEGSSPDTAPDASARLRALIARSEQTTAELRLLLPDVRDA
jgi:voltage-gated potassium channel